jgi:hypothetical protein
LSRASKRKTRRRWQPLPESVATSRTTSTPSWLSASNGKKRREDVLRKKWTESQSSTGAVHYTHYQAVIIYSLSTFFPPSLHFQITPLVHRLQGARHQELMANKKKIADQQDAVLRKLTHELESKRKEEEEIRELLDELYLEEAEQKSQARVDKDNENRLRMKQEMIGENLSPLLAIIQFK